MIKEKIMLNIAIVTNVITSYRESFYDKITNIDNYNIKIYCQPRVPGLNLKCIHQKYEKNIKKIKYIGLNHEKLGLQLLPYREIIMSHDIIFISGNPRVLSNILLSIIGILFKKRIIIWSNIHSYGAKQFTTSIRLKWLRLFKNLFIYLDPEVSILRKNGFNKQLIVAMNNGLDQNNIEKEKLNWDWSRLELWQKEKGISNKTILISIARLDPKNNFNQVIYSLSQLKDRIPDIHWCVIGDGSEVQNLKDVAKKFNIESNISFVGKLFEEEAIAPYMLSAKIFIHPSSVGLSLMHAYGYSLPVILDDNTDMHGPEHLIFTDSVNGYYFEKNNIKDLSNKIVKLLQNKETYSFMSLTNLNLVKKQYNSDIMIDRFVHIVENAS